MEYMPFANVNRKMLTWARERAHLTPDQLGKDAAEIDRIVAWEKGTQIPTVDQAEKLAKRLNVPFITFFLSNAPPEERLRVPDRRTIKDAKSRTLSANFREVINHAIVRQDWYREEFPKSAPRILGKRFTVQNSVDEIATFLKSALRMECPAFSVPVRNDKTGIERILRWHEARSIRQSRL